LHSEAEQKFRLKSQEVLAGADQRFSHSLAGQKGRILSSSTDAD